MTPEADRERDPAPGAVHEFADGEVSSYAGRIDRWLIVVYVVLALWAVYYLVVHWGGLGPGLEGQR